MVRSELARHDAHAIMQTGIQPFAADDDRERSASMRQPAERASRVSAISSLMIAERARSLDHRAVCRAVGSDAYRAKTVHDQRGACVVIVHAIDAGHRALMA